jgi:hypothetical protein
VRRYAAQVGMGIPPRYIGKLAPDVSHFLDPFSKNRNRPSSFPPFSFR